MLGPVIATTVTVLIHPVAGLFTAALFVTVGGFWLLSQRQTEPVPTSYTGASKTPSVLRYPAMLAIALTYAFVGAVLGCINLSVVAFSEQHHWQTASGVLLGIMALGSFISALLYGSRPWFVSQTKLFVGGLLVMAVGTSMIALVGSVPALAVAIFVTGSAISPTLTNVNNMVQKMVLPGQLTEGLTWLSTAMNLGISAGSAVVGTLIDRGGAHSGLWLAVGIGWAMVLVGLSIVPMLRRALRSAEAATGSLAQSGAAPDAASPLPDRSSESLETEQD